MARARLAGKPNDDAHGETLPVRLSGELGLCSRVTSNRKQLPSALDFC